MIVEVLYFAGCPNARPTLARVREVIGEQGVDAQVVAIEVAGSQEARRLRFPGSPTVRVDGLDIEPLSASGEWGACRLYAGSGVPPRGLLERALDRARR